MTTIHLPNDGRLTIYEVKRLLFDAVPMRGVATVTADMGSDGAISNIQHHGAAEGVAREFHQKKLDEGIPRLFGELGIAPRHVADPSLAGYRVGLVDVFGEPVPPPDRSYTISHADFVKIAELYGCRVDISNDIGPAQTEPAPEPAEATQAREAGGIDPSVLATPGELIDAFGKYTNMNASWFKKWKDNKALKNANKRKGTGGRGHTTEPLFCPFLVMQGLMRTPRKNSKRQPFKEDETPWRVLKRHFPDVYDMHQGLSPLDD